MAEPKITKARPLTYKPFNGSAVDIIIPFHGQYDRVSKLIESIMYTTRSNPYNIYLVDDASPNDKYIEDLKQIKSLITLRSNEQVGFGAACKIGFDAGNSPWVVIIQSDCKIEETNWLLEMGRTLLELKDKGVRMVAPKTNNPGADADPRLKSNKGQKSPSVIIEGFLPLYCVMFHRELFNHIGGFIKSYPYGMYEDEELAFRMKKYKFKQAICGNSWVYHEGGLTFESVCKNNPNAKKEIEANYDRCVADISKK